MARPRHQNGSLQKFEGKWKAHWHVYQWGPDGEKRKHHSKTLGWIKTPDFVLPVNSRLPAMTESEARRELQQLVAKAGVIDSPKKAATFGWFFENQWRPMREGRWRPGTKEVVATLFEKHILPMWGSVYLAQLSPAAVATWLNELAVKYSHSLTAKCCIYMKAVTREAADQDYVVKDPLRRVQLPTTKDEKKDFLTFEQVRALHLEMPTLRDRAIFEILIVCGLRPSELFALRWDDVGAGLRIDEAVVEGVLGKTKTLRSKGSVAMSKRLAATMEEWRAESQPGNPRDWIFPSKVGAPIWRRAWYKYVLKKAAERAGLKQINYQMLRRTFATLSADMGIPLKIIQQQMRHASILTTGDVYAQAVPSSVIEAVEAVSRKIFSA